MGYWAAVSYFRTDNTSRLHAGISALFAYEGYVEVPLDDPVYALKSENAIEELSQPSSPVRGVAFFEGQSGWVAVRTLPHSVLSLPPENLARPRLVLLGNGLGCDALCCEVQDDNCLYSLEYQHEVNAYHATGDQCLDEEELSSRILETVKSAKPLGDAPDVAVRPELLFEALLKIRETFSKNRKGFRLTKELFDLDVWEGSLADVVQSIDRRLGVEAHNMLHGWLAVRRFVSRSKSSRDPRLVYYRRT